MTGTASIQRRLGSSVRKRWTYPSVFDFSQASTRCLYPSTADTDVLPPSLTSHLRASVHTNIRRFHNVKSKSDNAQPLAPAGAQRCYPNVRKIANATTARSLSP